MRVTLVHPPITVTNPKRLPQIQPPLGMAYLAACARAAGHEVRVVDGLGEGIGRYSHFRGDHSIHGLSIEEIVERVDPAAEVIGVGIMFSNFWPLSKVLIRALRARCPHATIVCGGEHVTALPHVVLTGGAAPLIAPLADFVDSHVPDLCLMGVALAYRKATGDA